MRAILTVYMTTALVGLDGQASPMSGPEATSWYHFFIAITYFTPLFGAFISDVFWGKYKTIILLSIIYCLGHLALALDDTRVGLFLGQTFIALGAGGIKPCVSAHLGDQFGPKNQGLLSVVYARFYGAINLGAFFSMLLLPWLMAHQGPQWAFSLPGVLMLIATLIFWMGRYRFAHVAPEGPIVLERLVDPQHRDALKRLGRLFLFVAIFWSLFDQTGSSWVLQGQRMTPELFGFPLVSAQIQAANPLLILILTPLAFTLLYPFLNRLFTLTPLRKIALGMHLGCLAFVYAGLLEWQLDRGFHLAIGWQLLGYTLLTAAEVMVSITCLEFAYREAPKGLKSIVMALYLLSVATGNLLTSAINHGMTLGGLEGLLKGPTYFWFFSLIMLFAAVSFMRTFKVLAPVN
jgi:POT family proton-dependent oligopeptide transporter